MRIGSHEGLGHYSFHNSYRRPLMRVVKPLVIAGAIVLAPAIPKQSPTSHSSSFLAPRAAYAQELEIKVDPIMETIVENRCNSRSKNAFLSSVCDSSDGKTALAKAYQVAFNNLLGSLESNIKRADDGKIFVEPRSSLFYDIEDLLTNTQKPPSDFGLEFIKKDQEDQEEIVIADEASLAKVFSSVFVLQLGDIDLKVFTNMSLSAPTEENTQQGESPTTIEEQPEIIPFVQAAIDAWKAAVKNQAQKN